MSTGEAKGDAAGEDAIDGSQSPRARDWFWRSRCAKLWWALTALYWLGLEGLLLIPPDRMNFDLAGLYALFVLVLNPITILAVLGHRFLRAKIACGDWISVRGKVPDDVERSRRKRMAAYINPADARSGYMHQAYLDRDTR